MTTAVTGAEEVTWDLSDLYSGPDDPQIEADLSEGTEAARRFAADHHGHVAELDAAALADALRELERIEAIRLRLRGYAYLHFSEDTEDAARGALLQRAEEWNASLETELLFFRLEWTALEDDEAAALLDAPELEGYRHLLSSLRRYRPHLLSEPEERILTEKTVSGRLAWARLFQELVSGLRVGIDGEIVSLDDAAARLASPDADVRRQVGEAVSGALEDGLRTRVYALNSVLLDKSLDDRLRSFPHWIADRNLENQVDDEIVETLVEAIVARYDITHRYFALKAKLLGLPKLAHWDRLAPVAGSHSRVEWDDARSLVLDAYTEFSPDVGATVAEFFERRWIDAEARAGKMTGAYCMSRVPGVHPYVLLNYTGERRAVLTLAHELGHALHGTLAQQAGVFGSNTPLTLAETASVFGEALVFRSLLEQEQDPRRRLDLLIGSIDDAVATVFRQIAFNRFEDAVHRTRREEGELSPERLAELWIETQSAQLGDAVDLSGYESWWSYIVHFTYAPGYVYAYAFGYLFALSIFRRYEREGDSMIEPYLRLLSAGGSETPERLAGIVGLNIRERALWDEGLAAIDDLVTEAEELAASL
jgi:oligoendopeptidase F